MLSGLLFQEKRYSLMTQCRDHQLEAQETMSGTQLCVLPASLLSRKLNCSWSNKMPSYRTYQGLSVIFDHLSVYALLRPQNVNIKQFHLAKILNQEQANQSGLSLL
jgi:hypothetical protein